jgi:hypothetical protein
MDGIMIVDSLLSGKKVIAPTPRTGEVVMPTEQNYFVSSNVTDPRGYAPQAGTFRGAAETQEPTCSINFATGAWR